MDGPTIYGCDHHRIVVVFESELMLCRHLERIPLLVYVCFGIDVYIWNVPKLLFFIVYGCIGFGPLILVGLNEYLVSKY